MASIRERTNSKGETTYTAQVRLKGYPPETATFHTKTDAKSWARNTEAAMHEGRYFKTALSKKRTMAEAIDRYFKEILEFRENPINQKTYLRWWKKELGTYVLADVTPALIVEKRNALVGSRNRFDRTVSPSTANRYTQSLGHMFTVAKKEWGWVTENPVSNITKFKEPKGRVRFLSEQERGALLSACAESKNPYLYLVVVLAISTGARKEEITTLKWQHVDLERGQIVLDETKNGDRRAIPLQGYASDLMIEHARLRHLRCNYVFPSKKVKKDKNGSIIYQPVDIRRAYVNAVERAGIKDFRFHDLRHTAASYLAMNKASLVEMADVLGHKTLQMVKRYAHLSEAHTTAVVKSMNERIFSNECR